MVILLTCFPTPCRQVVSHKYIPIGVLTFLSPLYPSETDYYVMEPLSKLWWKGQPKGTLKIQFYNEKKNGWMNFEIKLKKCSLAGCTNLLKHYYYWSKFFRETPFQRNLVRAFKTITTGTLIKVKKNIFTKSCNLARKQYWTKKCD